MSTNILAIPGSLRKESTNKFVLQAMALLTPADVAVTIYEQLGDLPHFNPDLDGEGAPAVSPAVRDLRERVGRADAMAICSPEYAHGVSGTLKNALDWLVSGV